MKKKFSIQDAQFTDTDNAGAGGLWREEKALPRRMVCKIQNSPAATECAGVAGKLRKV